MVSWFDRLITIIFFSNISIAIASVIVVIAFGLFMWFVWPKISKWLSLIRLSDERAERKKTALELKAEMYNEKILTIHMNNSYFCEIKIGRIVGWSPWKPTFIYQPEEKKKLTDKNKIKTVFDYKTNFPDKMEILYYVPKTANILDLLMNKTEALIFEEKQIKYITNSEVVVMGDSVEPCISGYKLLTTYDTPVRGLARAMTFEQVDTIIDQMLMNLRKIAENGLNINPWEQAALEQNSPKLNIPAPAPKQSTVQQIPPHTH